MARFEMTTAIGEKILVDHAATGIDDILSELRANTFLAYTEVKAGGVGPARQVIVASSQIVTVRPLDELTTQSTTFRAKR